MKRGSVPWADGLDVRPSPIEGRGCFATARRLRGRQRIHICGLDSYWAIDGRLTGNGTQFINHSCQPNCSLRNLRGHLLFFALRDIEPGEEILLDYEWSYHSDRKACRCGAPACRGRINKPPRR